jgi:hypothetical protein
MRLAGVTTRAQANALVRSKLLPEFNRRFTVGPARRRNAHRDLGPEHHLAAILSAQVQRGVASDYTVPFRNRCFQLLPPAVPGLRRGQVIIEQRLDGAAKEFARAARLGGSAPQTPRSLTLLRPTPEAKNKDRTARTARSSGVQPTARRSGRTPAVPYPPNGKTKTNHKEKYRPATDHPWRTFLLRRN